MTKARGLRGAVPVATTAAARRAVFDVTPMDRPGFSGYIQIMPEMAPDRRENLST